MKFLLVPFSLIVALAYASSLSEDQAQFQAFKLQYGKAYATDEESKRLAIFRDNLQSIEEHNKLFEQGLVSWKKGITQFTDMTDEEYRSLLSLKPFRKPERGLKSTQIADVPESFDWRDQGAVTAVNDAGSCGSSWAFAIAESIESAYFLKTGQLVHLSVQQLLDCTSDYGNDGCSSGYLRETMPYVSFEGIQSEDSYPYKAEVGECQYNSSAVVTKIYSWVNFAHNQYQLLQAVANIGPVAASLDASQLKEYTGGIFASTTCSTDSPTLAVLIVGYGSENGTDFWIAKTSKGTNWGEEGYFRIARKANDFACGLYQQPVYPVII